MWHDKLKEQGVNIHVAATGAGAGIQWALWETPGSSAYLSGASFPYSPEEQEELLGFMPEHFCSQEAAIDLASAAYMKAYGAPAPFHKFGGKKPVGLGLTASVASEKEHRGDHRVFICVMTDDKVYSMAYTLTKGSGARKRMEDSRLCDELALFMLRRTLENDPTPEMVDATELARQRFMAHPFFTMEGKRYPNLINDESAALMPGAFNPPHQGHFGIADTFAKEYGKRVVFEITASPPHKDKLTVQDMLKRAKLLQGRDRVFSDNMPMYLDKARAFPGMPILMGADALLRIMDPKWGIDIHQLLRELAQLKTVLYVASRLVDGKWTSFDVVDSIMDQLTDDEAEIVCDVIRHLPGRWDVSSTRLREKLV